MWFYVSSRAVYHYSHCFTHSVTTKASQLVPASSQDRHVGKKSSPTHNEAFCPVLLQVAWPHNPPCIVLYIKFVFSGPAGNSELDDDDVLCCHTHRAISYNLQDPQTARWITCDSLFLLNSADYWWRWKGKSYSKSGTCYSAAYTWTRDQKRFTISEMVADWHELVIPRRIMRPSIARASEQLYPRCSTQTHHRPNQPH